MQKGSSSALVTSTLASLAVAGLVSGCAEKTQADPTKDSAKPAQAPSGSASAGHKDCCRGKNDCKGKGGCKTDASDCAGKNDCKGKGGCSMRDCK